MTVATSVLCVFVLFAFLLLEYTTFFWFRRRYSPLAGFLAANIVAIVFGAGLLVPLELLGVLDLVHNAGVLR
jgi:hypothetical protein